MGESYQVIARRWRPKQFDELVGQEHIVRTLKNAIEGDRIAHAYLFVGPRGTGKTTTARIFAKALNAEGGPQVRPDDNTPISRAIMNGSCMDVIEIDGASNNGVDDIRDLREECQYAPTEGNYKIYIIDEVHMLSNNAWNALLKTLEEPPPHVKFIFATTEAHKVLATVVSRCQRFEFRPISDELIVGKLGAIAQAEAIEIEPVALQSIARMADGGMRDAQSILDQLISFCGNNITEANVLDVYGLASEQSIQDMASAMARGDYAAMVSQVEAWADGGRDLYRVLMDLQTYVRAALLDAIKKGQTAKLGTPMSAEALMRMLDALHAGESAIRQGLSQRVNFEVSLLKAVEASRTRAIDSVIKELSQVAAGLPQEAGQKKIEISPATDEATTIADTPPAASENGQRERSAVWENEPFSFEDTVTDSDERHITGIEFEDDARRDVCKEEENLSQAEVVCGPKTREFELANAKISNQTRQLLDDLLRAEFKFVRKVKPHELNVKRLTRVGK